MAMMCSYGMLKTDRDKTTRTIRLAGSGRPPWAGSATAGAKAQPSGVHLQPSQLANTDAARWCDHKKFKAISRCLQTFLFDLLKDAEITRANLFKGQPLETTAPKQSRRLLCVTKYTNKALLAAAACMALHPNA